MNEFSIMDMLYCTNELPPIDILLGGNELILKTFYNN